MRSACATPCSTARRPRSGARGHRFVRRWLRGRLGASFLALASAPLISHAAPFAPSPDQTSLTFGQLGMMVTFLLIILGAIVAYEKLRRRPPIEAEFATKIELERVRTESAESDRRIEEKVDKLRGEITAGIIASDAKSEDRVSGLHRRMDAVFKGLSKVGRGMAHVNARLASVDCMRGKPCPSLETEEFSP